MAEEGKGLTSISDVWGCCVAGWCMGPERKEKTDVWETTVSGGSVAKDGGNN